MVSTQFDNIFPHNAKQLAHRYLKDQLTDYLAHLEISNIIVTDASLSKEKTGVGIFSPSFHWYFPIRLPDYTLVFIAKVLPIVLALRKLPSSEPSAVIITDSLSVCNALSVAANAELIDMFRHLLLKNLKKTALRMGTGAPRIIFERNGELLSSSIPEWAHHPRFARYGLRNRVKVLKCLSAMGNR